MRTVKASRGAIRFGAFEVNIAARELRKNGRKIKIQDQAFEILGFLLRDPGGLVTREQLRQALWPSDTFVDFEHGLNRVVSKLREAIGDSATDPKYIETVARHGYRFIAPIEIVNYTAHWSKAHELGLAVLPFTNLSGDPVQEFFSDGITEEMIAQLGQLDPKRLGVIARTSAMHYKGSNKGVGQIGRELQVDYILEGSVRRVGERVRITAQLIGVADQTHLWCESYDCDLNDVLAIQSDVACRVRRSLAASLFIAERAKKSRIPPVDSAAYDAYLRGRYYWSKRHEGGLNKAIECFERAIEHDAGFALAYSGVADSYALLSWYGELPPSEAGLAARSAAIRAIELDDNLGEAHASLGLTRFWYGWDWRGAETEFRKALELSPNYAAAHQWFASYLMAMERFDDATAELQQALELDPLSLIIIQSMGDPPFYARHYDEAILRYQRAIELNPDFAPAHFSLGRAYVQERRYQEAIQAFQKANALSGNIQAAAAMAHALARSGAREEASRVLNELTRSSEQRYVSSVAAAVVHLGLEEHSRALELLEKALQEGSCWLPYVRVDPIYDPVRQDARFQKLLRSLGLDKLDTVAA